MIVHLHCLNGVQAFTLAQWGAFQIRFNTLAPATYPLPTTLDKLTACLGNLRYSDPHGNPRIGRLYPRELFR